MWRLVEAGILTYTETKAASWVDMERAHLALDLREIAELQAQQAED